MYKLKIVIRFLVVSTTELCLKPVNDENPRIILKINERIDIMIPTKEPKPKKEGLSFVIVFITFGASCGKVRLINLIVRKYNTIAITKYEIRIQNVLFIFSHTEKLDCVI